VILGEDWRVRWQQFRLIFSLKKPWAPMLCAGLAYGASHIQSPSIRWATAGAVVILFLIAGVDVALGLVETDPGPSNPLRTSQKVPVTPFHIMLAGALGAVYAFLILGALLPLISVLTLPTLWVLAIVAPATFLIACLVAWRNVRLWAHEGVEYEELLNERKNELAEKERLKQMRLPESFWDHPLR
jgi:hypothetical protein